MSILLFNEGVLQSDTDRPILQGFQLAMALGTADRLIVATAATEKRMTHQLRTERLQDLVAEVLDCTYNLPPLPLWQRQIEIARSRSALTMVVTGDPAVAEWVLERDLTVLFFSHPGFSRPAMRPLQGNRSWEQLVQEVESR